MSEEQKELDVISKYGIEIIKFMSIHCLCSIFNSPRVSPIHIALIINNASKEVQNCINDVLIDVRRVAVKKAINHLQQNEQINSDVVIKQFLNNLRDMSACGSIILPEVDYITKYIQNKEESIDFDLFKLPKPAIIRRLVEITRHVRYCDTNNIFEINVFFNSLKDDFSRKIIPLVFQSESWDIILDAYKQELNKILKHYRMRLKIMFETIVNISKLVNVESMFQIIKEMQPKISIDIKTVIDKIKELTIPMIDFNVSDEDFILSLLYFTDIAKNNGLLSCEKLLQNRESSYFSKGMMMVIDGIDIEDVRCVLKNYGHNIMIDIRIRMRMLIKFCEALYKLHNPRLTERILSSFLYF
ncbi:MAG: hypothetical protein HQK76_14890 [Desulfobacterales bacterium]|nr:hypothetical protein [Desulfobacterales bacterium]